MDSSDIIKIDEIVFMGAGYVGVVSSAVLAKYCNEIKVTIVDIDENKIKMFQSGIFPFFEPMLKNIVDEVNNKNLYFDSDIKNSLKNADLVFICVNTPYKKFGFGKGRSTDLSYVDTCTLMIKEYCQKKNVIVAEKSTVPITAAQNIDKVLNNDMNNNERIFYILSNPEFLREGSAINDTINPDRVIIGGFINDTNNKAIESLKKLYSRWIDEEKIITTDIWSSELSKLVSNALLAQKLSSINSISALCEKTKADILEVKKCVGSDKRIGTNYMMPSLGFGGSCFQKDLWSLIYICESVGLEEVGNYWYQVLSMNKYQRKRFIHTIITTIGENDYTKRICIYGAAFKKSTSDLRESSSIYIICKLLNIGYKINLTDPLVNKNELYQYIKSKTKSNVELQNCFTFERDPYKATNNCDAIIICTEWDYYCELDYSKIYESMNKPAYIFDGRLILDRKQLQKIGFNFFVIGRPNNN